MPEDSGLQPGSSGRFGETLRDVVSQEASELGLDKIDFVQAALKWQYNWIGLAGAAAFALISGTGLPLVLAAGLELMYLALVPRSSAFRRLIRSRVYAAEKRKREIQLTTMFMELPPEMRSRYSALDAICRAIRANYARLSSTSQMFLEQMEQRLQGLLQAYLRLLFAGRQHAEYLRITDAGAIKHDVAKLQESMKTDSPRVQEINTKRVEILGKRLEKFEKVKENQKVVDAQLAAIEDILQLIRDQSVTMRDPQQVNDQLDNLVHDVEQTEETVRQVESIFSMASPNSDTLGPLPSEMGESESAAASRQRLRN
jgi:hypothetical protein